MATWLRRVGDDTWLVVHVQTGAKKSETAGTYGNALKVRLMAAPIDGRANAELLQLIATRLGLPKSAIHLAHGQTSREKVLKLTGAPGDIETRLLAR